MKHQGNRNKVLYVVFYKLFDDTSYFSNERTWNFAIFDNNNNNNMHLFKHDLVTDKADVVVQI